MRVLIVDDDGVRANMLAQNMGCADSTTFARTPMSAIKYIRTRKYDCIFLDHDLGVPKLTGVDVAACMFKSTNMFTPVIVHSCNPVGAENIKNTVDAFGGRAHIVSLTDGDFVSKATACLEDADVGGWK